MGGEERHLAREQNIIGEMFFFKNHAENKAGRLVPDLFLFFKNLYIRKASGVQLSVNVF